MVEAFKKDECIVDGVSYNKPGECGQAKQALRDEQQANMVGGKRRRRKSLRNKRKSRKTRKQRGGRRMKKTRRLRNTRKQRKSRRRSLRRNNRRRQHGGSGGKKESVSHQAIANTTGDSKGADTAKSLEDLSAQVKYNNA